MYVIHTVRDLLTLLGKRVRLRSGEVVRLPEDGEWFFLPGTEHQACLTTGDLYVYVATGPSWNEGDIGPGDILKVLPDEPDKDAYEENTEGDDPKEDPQDTPDF
jgi:hypothetical protein